METAALSGPILAPLEKSGRGNMAETAVAIIFDSSAAVYEQWQTKVIKYISFILSRLVEGRAPPGQVCFLPVVMVLKDDS